VTKKSNRRIFAKAMAWYLIQTLSS
jgi:hypothetical protein